MSDYSGNILELISVDHQPDMAVLHIKQTGAEEKEIIWNIDAETGAHLKTLMTGEVVYKYRLSFQYNYISIKKQYVSTLSRTYRDKSEKLYLLCSESYIHGLKALRQGQLTNEMKPFVKEPIELPVPEEPLQAEGKRFTLKAYYPLVWAAITFLIIAAMMLIPWMMKSELAEGATQHNEKAQKPKTVKQTASPIKHAKAQPNTAKQATLPAVQLQDLLSFSIPEGKVALTFDDGPSKYTEEIVDILKEQEAGGTFFFIGNNVTRYPKAVQYANAKGYTIGNHSMDHADLTALNHKQQQYELLHTNKLIEQITHKKVSLFRPPYGAKNDQLINLIKKTNSKMVLWNRDTEDWKNRNAKVILKYVQDSEASGSIILLHESQASVEALPHIIKYLKEKKLDIVNLN